MKLTFDQFQKIVGNIKNANAWYEAIVKIAPKYQINTEDRWAGFLAQVGHESGNFKYVEENLYYTATRINQVFPKYFKNAGRSTKGYAKNPKALGSLVYADRMGNGNEKSGEGYTYRGRGLIQLTGKNNYTKFANHLGMSVEKAAEYASTVEGAVESAMWYWGENNINVYCDRRDIKGMTYAINGGDNGLKDRKERWEKALSILSDRSNEDVWADGIISIGDRGEEVRMIQSHLGIVADGIFGPNTKRAVKQFQRDNKLIPDGIIGPRTFKTILED